MASIYQGLEAALSGLTASQNALNVTAQNVANSGTTGYTRQQLDTSSAGPGTGAYRYLQSTILIGQGVNINGVSQIRNIFLDAQYRTQNADYQKWQSLSDNLSQVEDIFNEFATNGDKAVGISGQMSNLISDLQDYEANSDDANLPITVMTDYQTLCKTLNSDYSDLVNFQSQMQGDLSATIDGSGTEGGINAILKNVQSLNQQIASYEITGQKANDLRDQRNNLLDELSGYVNIDVSEQSNGMVTVSLADDTSGNMLVDSSNNITGLKLNDDKTEVEWDDAGSTQAAVGGGQVEAYLEVINGNGPGDPNYTNVGVPYMMNKLNNFAAALVSLTNGIAPSSPALLQASDTNPASDIGITSDWLNDNSLLAENCNADTMGDYISSFVSAYQTSPLTVGGTTYQGSLADYADSISIELGNEVSYDSTMATSTQNMTQDIDTQRKSVSSVSIDEEGVNIIRYTQSYNAAARVITAIDQLLDKLINGTGLVGLT